MSIQQKIEETQKQIQAKAEECAQLQQAAQQVQAQLQKAIEEYNALVVRLNTLQEIAPEEVKGEVILDDGAKVE